jgi:type I restriction enzyme S subunit
VLRQQGGMAQQHFNVGEMKELLVALPKMKEQLDFRAKASVIADKLKIERALLDKLKKQKNGLMHDLLTGKVHVKPETTALEVTGG